VILDGDTNTQDIVFEGNARVEAFQFLTNHLRFRLGRL
jgi:hypothetical protein